MPCTATVEISDLRLITQIGLFGPGERAPDQHLLDLTLSIRPELVLIKSDGMAHVFDYDPLVVEIDRLARDGQYETQERLITLIAQACAEYTDIEAVDISLKKSPVLSGTGSLGIRLRVDADEMKRLRTT